jgi:hypothetical protein
VITLIWGFLTMFFPKRRKPVQHKRSSSGISLAKMK